MPDYPTTQDRFWLDQCTIYNRVLTLDDREVFFLTQHVIKMTRVPWEVVDEKEKIGIFVGEADYEWLVKRDENEVRAINLIRKHTRIPVPRVIHQGFGFNVFERKHGTYLNNPQEWLDVKPANREKIRLQVRSWLEQLKKIPNPTGAIQSLIPSGELIHEMFRVVGPFASTVLFLAPYVCVPNMQRVHKINTRNRATFAHMSLNIFNIVVAPTQDRAVSIINWDRSAFFPEGGRAVHESYIHPKGWETLFDKMEFPILEVDDQTDDIIFQDGWFIPGEPI
ncbi:MAG: hypothetical protein M4579_002672 [Chaenotheca gracillima]|nr:MAG: hypothetical protein M4579_002672 [Chaenotheca gracillima]